MLNLNISNNSVSNHFLSQNTKSSIAVGQGYEEWKSKIRIRLQKTKTVENEYRCRF